MLVSLNAQVIHLSAALVKQLEEYNTDTDQLTNLGVGGVSSTCPTTKVILPHTWGKMANTGCLIVKNDFSLSVCMQINHYHVE